MCCLGLNALVRVRVCLKSEGRERGEFELALQKHTCVFLSFPSFFFLPFFRPFSFCSF